MSASIFSVEIKRSKVKELHYIDLMLTALQTCTLTKLLMFTPAGNRRVRQADKVSAKLGTRSPIFQSTAKNKKTKNDIDVLPRV